jgi:hypothetical protein
MSILSNSVAPNAICEIMLPYRLSATSRQASFATLKPRLRQHDNTPHQGAAAPAQNPESAFPRIYPLNPEPAAAPVQNPNSAFSRIYPVNPEPPTAPTQNPNSTFPRIYPMNPEPPSAPAATPRSTFPRTNPSRSAPSHDRPASTAPPFLRHLATSARLTAITRGRPIAP